MHRRQTLETMERAVLVILMGHLWGLEAFDHWKGVTCVVYEEQADAPQGSWKAKKGAGATCDQHQADCEVKYLMRRPSLQGIVATLILECAFLGSLHRT
jgi:hypothetical protein